MSNYVFIEEEDETPRVPLSSNQWSVDLQVVDVVDWLNADETPRSEAYEKFVEDFPEFQNVVERQVDLNPNWHTFDLEDLGLDIQWVSWLVESLESTGLVWWEEGEPWANEEDVA